MLTFMLPTQVHLLFLRFNNHDRVHVVFFGCVHRVEVHSTFASVPQTG